MIYFSTLTGELQPLGVNFDLPVAPVNADGEEAGNINLTLPL